MTCRKCSFGGFGEYVSGYGSDTAKLAIIGESPGSLEAIYGSPFLGESGGFLNWVLRKTKIIKDESERFDKVWLDNVIRCQPSNDITVEHLIKCRHFFANKLLKIKPKIIVALGSKAAKSVLKDYSFSIDKAHSFWVYSDEFDCWVMPIFHPAKILRDWGLTSVVLRAFQKVSKALKDGVPKQQLGNHYVTADTTRKVNRLFRSLSKQKRVAFDLETTSTKYWEDTEKIIGASFCWKEGKAVWLPLIGQNGRKVWKERGLKEIKKLLKIFLENETIKKEGANIKFDINFCRTIDIEVKGVDHDVMQWHHLVDENTPANLTYLTSYYNLNFPRYEDEIKQHVMKHPIFANSKTYIGIPELIIAKYACADVDATFRISEIQRKYATERQRNLYEKFSAPLSKVTANMEYRGALINVKRIEKLEKKYEKKIEKESIVFSKLCKSDTVNVNSSPQMQKLLFETLKFEPITKTKAGNFSTGKDVIELIKRKTKGKKKLKILGYITEIRQMRKMKSTYLTGFKKIVDKNNRLHTTYLTTGTVTGRPASISPNLANCLSKKDTEVLTKRGWKKCGSIGVGDEIASYLPISEVLKFSPVLKIYNGIEVPTTRFYKKHGHYDMTVTDAHRIYFRQKNSGYSVIKDAKTFLKDAKIINSAVLEGGRLREDINVLRFAIMYNRDGWLHSDKCGMEFSFVKPRKVKRFLEITKSLDIKYMESPPKPYSSKKFPNGVMRRFYVYRGFKNFDLLLKLEKWIDIDTKQLKWVLLQLTTKLRKKVFKEYFYWDGNYTTKNGAYLSKDEYNVDICQALGVSLGYRITKSFWDRNGKKYHVANVCYTNETTTSNTIVEDSGSMPVWCCSVDSKAFLVRSRGSVFVTGNIPRDPIFRSLFIAGLNRKLCVADYSQVEDRLMAFYAGEKDLLEKYQDNEFDPHTLTSAAVRNKRPEDVTKEERSFDKAVKFGMNYGRSAKSIAETYDMKIEEVEEFMRNYFETHKAIAKYRNKNVKMSKRGFLDNANGRRRHFSAYEWLYSPEMENVRDLRESSGTPNYVIDAIISGMERQALNFPIQSVAFDSMILAMDRIRKELKKGGLLDSYLILTVYDMVAVECPKKDTKRVKKIIKKCMPFQMIQKELQMDVTFPADLTVSGHWKQ